MAHDVFREFLQLVERFALTDYELAALTGLSAPTVRTCRRLRQLPSRQPRCLRAVEAFVARARSAKSRADLTLPG